MNEMNWEIEKIINVANELQRKGSTGASTGERIAAAFVLDRMEFLPPGYGVVEAWERLEVEWQHYVKEVRQHYPHLINVVE